MRIGIYNYNRIFYTGTDVQPDVLNIFIKHKRCLESNNIPLANLVGYFPILSLFSGSLRIANAVKIIFKKLSNLKALSEDAHKSKLWNAFKNLFRGIVEIIPFTGIPLIVFDSFRMSTFIHKINKELKEKENIAGVAIDGKVIFTIDLGRVDLIIKDQPTDHSRINEYRLAVFRDLCLKILEKVEESKSKVGMDKLFSEFANQI